MTDLSTDLRKLMRQHPEKPNVPGDMLTKSGLQNYVGSVPAISGVLFFSDAHLPHVRLAILRTGHQSASTGSWSLKPFHWSAP